MIREDRYGLLTSSTETEAIHALEEAVHGVGAHRPNAATALGRAISLDPDHVAAHALKGFACLILARKELVPDAAQALKDARSALRRRDGGTRDERVLVDALSLALDGYFGLASDKLDAGFADRPAAFLPFKLSHSLRFMIGDGPGMLAASRRMLGAWSEDNEAAGFLLGCHAFALEESGAYAEAEAAGRQAVSLQREDAWGMHAVGHVYEMSGDAEAGISWLESGRGDWSRCNNFSFHMAWHLGLLHLERGEHDQVLQLYDEDVRPEQTDDFRDVANAVSLLWRLEHSGAAVGRRWEELAEIARRRAQDTSLMFAVLHNLLALVASGDEANAALTLQSISERAKGEADQSRVAAEIGLPLARLISDLMPGACRDGLPAQETRLTLDDLLGRLPRIGGSNAQRDVFVLALADHAARRGDELSLARIKRARNRLKAEDNLLEAVGRHAARMA
ncbi:tetratricopeptide repeat protein [Amaricoccus macauensis]|uniref:tetratricopeptide repeat protein n=1 Tax=Amaricoccus macauensis TaxID=57001 RepID=UPI003C7E529B